MGHGQLLGVGREIAFRVVDGVMSGGEVMGIHRQHSQ
ncbi:MAG: hypothetical protein JWN02_985, partial [Acidobacteria bacterium]|nr:hypothetical protein [Acidobacteriota bacterium]